MEWLEKDLGGRGGQKFLLTPTQKKMFSNFSPFYEISKRIFFIFFSGGGGVKNQGGSFLGWVDCCGEKKNKGGWTEI